MSSTVQSTEIHTIGQKSLLLSAPKMEEKNHQRLVRTSSLDKIRRFNTYICSQQYFILPALLAWLNSSQPGLPSSTEKTIFFFRSLIFNNVFYKLLQLDFKALISNTVLLVLAQIKKSRNNVEGAFALKLFVYLTALILISELGVCLYMLCNCYVPSGMIFLIVCWFYIIYLNVTSMFHSEKKNFDHLVAKKVK